MRSDFIIGIDEVGRGALAGPVVVAAARVGAGFRTVNRTLGKLRDSKKMSAKKREAWFAYFCDHPKISYAVAFVYPRQIEKRNISGAANLAALRAYERMNRESGIGNREVKLFLDGGLFLGSRKSQPSHAQTIVKADEKIPAVAIASIIAKVTRDRAMVRLGKLHPHYGLAIHKGYGTKMHKEALFQYGRCGVHRATFLGKII
jgi:ribonuclease HII